MMPTTRPRNETTARPDPDTRPSKPVVVDIRGREKRLTIDEAHRLIDQLREAVRAAEVAEEDRLVAARVMCKWCGNVFHPRRRGMIYCEEKCRDAFRRYRLRSAAEQAVVSDGPTG
jgi:hypothetical protein